MTESIRGDVLTKERTAKLDIQIVQGKRGGVEFRSTQIPIDHYFKRRIFNEAEYRAASKLFYDFTVSGQTPGMTLDLMPSKTSPGGFTMAQLEARERWRLAINAIHGTIAKMMVINVCCYGHWLADTNYLHYKSSRHAMARLHEALDDLIKYYDANRKI